MSGVANPAEQGRSRIGFVGLGNQGSPIAERIARAGHDLILWARRPEALDAFQGKAGRANSLIDLAAGVEILCICVVDDAGVTGICNDAIAVMTPGSLIAIMSTVHPDTCRAIGKTAAARGIAVIDAPVSGGAMAARDGRLAVMMGGSPADCTRFMAIVESFSGFVVRLGDLGAGQAAKLINNALLTANMMLAYEAAACGDVLGLDRVALSELIAASSGNSGAYAILSRLPNIGAFAGGARLLAKDVDLFAALLAGAGGSTEHIVGDASDFLAIANPPPTDPTGSP